MSFDECAVLFTCFSVSYLLVVSPAQLAQDRADFGIVESDEDSDTEDAQRRAEIEKMKVCTRVFLSRVTLTRRVITKRLLAF